MDGGRNIQINGYVPDSNDGKEMTSANRYPYVCRFISYFLPYHAQLNAFISGLRFQ